MISSGSIPPETRVLSVSLNVAHLDRALAFYQGLLGLHLHRRGPAAVLPESGGQVAVLGSGDLNLVELVEIPGASQPRVATGLYHLALRVPCAAWWKAAGRCRALPTTG